MSSVNYKCSCWVSEVTQHQFDEDTAVCKIAGGYFVGLTNLNVVEGLEDRIKKKIQLFWWLA